MDDRSISVTRWSVVRAYESSRHQRQLLAQAYQQVFPQVRQSLSKVDVAAARCGSGTGHSTAARVAAGA
jgi:hypothetical protein